jgi:hypothetical protein
VVGGQVVGEGGAFGLAWEQEQELQGD